MKKENIVLIYDSFILGVLASLAVGILTSPENWALKIYGTTIILVIIRCYYILTRVKSKTYTVNTYNVQEANFLLPEEELLERKNLNVVNEKDSINE